MFWAKAGESPWLWSGREAHSLRHFNDRKLSLEKARALEVQISMAALWRFLDVDVNSLVHCSRYVYARPL